MLGLILTVPCFYTYPYCRRWRLLLHNWDPKHAKIVVKVIYYTHWNIHCSELLTQFKIFHLFLPLAKLDYYNPFSEHQGESLRPFYLSVSITIWIITSVFWHVIYSRLWPNPLGLLQCCPGKTPPSHTHENKFLLL